MAEEIHERYFITLPDGSEVRVTPETFEIPGARLLEKEDNDLFRFIKLTDGTEVPLDVNTVDWLPPSIPENYKIGMTAYTSAEVRAALIEASKPAAAVEAPAPAVAAPAAAAEAPAKVPAREGGEIKPEAVGSYCGPQGYIDPQTKSWVPQAGHYDAAQDVWVGGNSVAYKDGKAVSVSGVAVSPAVERYKLEQAVATGAQVAAQKAAERAFVTSLTSEIVDAPAPAAAPAAAEAAPAAAPATDAKAEDAEEPKHRSLRERLRERRDAWRERREERREAAAERRENVREAGGGLIAQTRAWANRNDEVALHDQAVKLEAREEQREARATERRAVKEGERAEQQARVECAQDALVGTEPKRGLRGRLDRYRDYREDVKHETNFERAHGASEQEIDEVRDNLRAEHRAERTAIRNQRQAERQERHERVEEAGGGPIAHLKAELHRGNDPWLDEQAKRLQERETHRAAEEEARANARRETEKERDTVSTPTTPVVRNSGRIIKDA